MFACTRAVPVLATLLTVCLYLPAAAGDSAAGPVTMEQAVATAMATVPNGKFVHSLLDRDDGRDIFEVLIIDDKFAYEIEVDAMSNAIVHREQEAIVKGAGTMTPTLERARDKALEASGGGDVISVEEEMQGGRQIVEIDIINQGVKHEIDVDASTGAILDHDRDYLD